MREPICLDVAVRPVPGFPVRVSAEGAIYGPKGLRKRAVALLVGDIDGVRGPALAERYGVRKSTVARVVRGESWRHLP